MIIFILINVKYWYFSRGGIVYTKKIFLIAGALTLLVLLSTALFFANKQSEKVTSIDYDQSLSIKQQIEKNNQEIIKKEQLRNNSVIIAIYGSDARSTEIARSDVIMLIKYNPIDNKAAIISLPRDSIVDIPGKGKDKVSHAYAFGGAGLLTQTLENLFDTKIDYYIIFNFRDFEDIVDKFGGVRVNAKKNYGYDPDKPIILKGESILNGKQALFYVRFRYDEDGDFGRIKRQQEVVESLYMNFYKYNFEKRIITEIFSQDLDTNLDPLTFLEYKNMADKSSHINFENYTVETSDAYINEIYYGIVNNHSLEIIKKRLKNKGAFYEKY